MKARVNPFRRHNFNRIEMFNMVFYDTPPTPIRVGDKQRQLIASPCLPDDGWSFPRENSSCATKRT